MTLCTCGASGALDGHSYRCALRQPGMDSIVYSMPKFSDTTVGKCSTEAERLAKLAQGLRERAEAIEAQAEKWLELKDAIEERDVVTAGELSKVDYDSFRWVLEDRPTVTV